jgi:hypothetical protein
LTGGWLVVSHDTTTSGTGPGSASSASVLTASDGQPDAASVIPEGLDGSPMVLIITVQGAAESIEVTCPTTTARAPFDRLTVKPDQVMDAVHRWCSQTWLGP